MKRTYHYSGVLLSAWRGRDTWEAALSILDDSNREFVTSHVIRLEPLPEPLFEKRYVEALFYRAYFEAAVADEPLRIELGDEAARLAERHGLAAVDTLHVAAAIRLGAREFILRKKVGSRCSASAVFA